MTKKKIAQTFLDEYEEKGSSILGKYKNIGSGSSRNVFDIGNGLVAKLANGIEEAFGQNLVECNVYKNATNEQRNFLAKIFGNSRDLSLVIMEKAKSISASNLQEVFNDHNDIIVSLKDKFNLDEEELTKDNAWGEVNGRPVLIDYGCDKQIIESLQADTYDDEEKNEEDKFELNEDGIETTPFDENKHS